MMTLRLDLVLDLFLERNHVLEYRVRPEGVENPEDGRAATGGACWYNDGIWLGDVAG